MDRMEKHIWSTYKKEGTVARTIKELKGYYPAGDIRWVIKDIKSKRAKKKMTPKEKEYYRKIKLGLNLLTLPKYYQKKKDGR